jgi:hypothetical protein
LPSRNRKLRLLGHVLGRVLGVPLNEQRDVGMSTLFEDTGLDGRTSDSQSSKEQLVHLFWVLMLVVDTHGHRTVDLFTTEDARALTAPSNR